MVNLNENIPSITTGDRCATIKRHALIKMLPVGKRFCVPDLGLPHNYKTIERRLPALPFIAPEKGGKYWWFFLSEENAKKLYIQDSNYEQSFKPPKQKIEPQPLTFEDKLHNLACGMGGLV